MTMIRRLALKISNKVVTYCRADRRDWAEALAGEIAFIENDWTALRWALGSTRVLFMPWERPVASIDELATAAEKYAQSQSKKTKAVLFPPMIWVFLCTLQFLEHRDGFQRLVNGVLLVAWLSNGVLTWISWRNGIDVPSTFESNVVIQYYKAGLEQMCRSYQLALGWITFPLMALGTILTLTDGNLRTHPMICIGGGRLNDDYFIACYMGLLSELPKA